MRKTMPRSDAIIIRVAEIDLSKRVPKIVLDFVLLGRLVAADRTEAELHSFAPKTFFRIEVEERIALLKREGFIEQDTEGTYRITDNGASRLNRIGMGILDLFEALRPEGSLQ